VPAEYLACVRAKGREEFWRAELAVEAVDRKPWVALVDERIVGFASGGLSRDEDAPRETGEVYQDYVDPECWRRGIGTGLLRHVLRDLREHGFADAQAWVLAANEGSRAFVERQGWQLTGASRFEDCGGTQVEHVRYGRALQ
jgi:L-amino acid N-acyltransferase YncA